jgi:hypothetical protein
MAATVLDGIDAVKAAAGTHLGQSNWAEMSQERADLFDQATGAPSAPGPAGGVAPYLALAMSNFFLPQIVEVRGISLGVNYGCESIRFPNPVPVGAEVRARAELTSVAEIAGGVQTITTIVIEMRGASDPVCVIESVSRYLV